MDNKRWHKFYSSVAAARMVNPAAPSTTVSSLEHDSSAPDVDRLVSCEELDETFRRDCVGSIMGVVEF